MKINSQRSTRTKFDNEILHKKDQFIFAAQITLMKFETQSRTSLR